MPIYPGSYLTVKRLVEQMRTVCDNAHVERVLKGRELFAQAPAIWNWPDVLGSDPEGLLRRVK